MRAQNLRDFFFNLSKFFGMETKSSNFKTILKIYCRSCLEYLGTKPVVGLGSYIFRFIRGFKGLESWFILLSPLGTLELAFDRSKKVTELFIFLRLFVTLGSKKYTVIGGNDNLKVII